MRLAVMLLVAMTPLAFAGPGAPRTGLSTIVVVKKPDDSAADAKLAAAFTHSAVRTKLGRCWRSAVRAKARVVVAKGKLMEVAVVDTEDAKTSPCIVKALRSAVVRRVPDGAAVVEIAAFRYDGPIRILSSGNSGDRTSDDINRVIKAKAGEIRKCYQRELARAHPDLAGKIIVRFTIERDGKVKSARLQSSTMGHGGVESCVVAAVARLKFSTAASVSHVTYPFIFAKE